MTALELDLRLPLDRFSLEVALTAEQPVTGIFGASGAGKSSLLESVAGLRRAAHGRIALDGEVWLDSSARLRLPPSRRAVGYVPQEGLLFPQLDVRGNLLAGARRARKEGKDPEELLARVVPILELEPLLDRTVTSLSGGERQRVALGRALCSGPRLLLLDEPLASLDLPLRRRLLPLLRRLREEMTIPMLLVSHDPVEVQALCDELIVLHRGAVLTRGEPRAVLTDPEVFPLARREGFENLLSGRLCAAEGRRNARVRLGSGAELTVAAPAEDAGAGAVVTDEVGKREVLVGVSATDVLLATEPPRGLSARNVLAARVREIRSFEHEALVTAVLKGELAEGESGEEITVEVTATTPGRLGLEVGAAVYLVIKATACRLIGSEG